MSAVGGEFLSARVCATPPVYTRLTRRSGPGCVRHAGTDDKELSARGGVKTVWDKNGPSGRAQIVLKICNKKIKQNTSWY